ncbi:MAG: DUF362 domain-containing protein [Candidatus Geothermincolia bacterium]
MPKVILQPVADDLDRAVAEALDPLGGASLIKDSGEVFIKVNGIDFKPFTFTDPDAVGAAIRYFRARGASKVYVMENATQSNFTRLVFKVSGILDAVKRNGAIPLYLDEGKQVPYNMPTLGYEVRVSRWVKERLIDGKAHNLYVSMPKLKTHSMSTVTLSVKNQMGLLRHIDRIPDHNFKLHQKLADIYGLVRPDIALIEGIYAVFHGHYPAEALAARSTEKLNLLIAGDDPVATDVVASQLLGFSLNEVEHLRIAAERGYGEGDISKIEIVGDMAPYQRHYSQELLPDFPADVRVIQGSERCCREGCKNNTLTLTQMIYMDFQGKGGFTIVMGKGHDPKELEEIRGRVLVVGPCSIEEAEAGLKERLGKRNVRTVWGCNNLRDNTAHQLKLMKVSPIKMVPMNPVVSAWYLLNARLHRTSARIPPIIPR